MGDTSQKGEGDVKSVQQRGHTETQKRHRSIIEETIAKFKRDLRLVRNDQYKEYLGEKIEQLEKLKKLGEKRKRKGLTWSEVWKAQKILCFNSLAFCCAPSKGCPLYLAVCEALGLDPKELAEFKLKATLQYLEIHTSLNRRF